VVAPSALTSDLKLAVMPCTAAAMATTTNTPIATPPMVSAARTRLARIASRAIHHALEQSEDPVGDAHGSVGPKGGEGSRRDARLAG
jgi:hypothetical protein